MPKEMTNRNFCLRISVAAALAAVGLAHSQPTQLKTLAAARGVNIGAAITFPGSGRATFDSLISWNFNIVVPENAMKWGNIQPTQGNFSYTSADQLVDWAQAHAMKVRFHTFVWHQQSSFMANGTSNGVAQPAANSFDRAGAFTQMRNHINTVMTRYKTRNPNAFLEWDVVNEAVARDSAGMRLSTGRDSLLSRWVGYTQGETNDFDYVDSAFVIAHRADSSAKLVYNDYDAEHMGIKGNLVYALVSKLKNRNIPVHAVGMQCHWHLNQPGTSSNGGWDPTQFKQNMTRLAALGLDLSITELDIRVTTPSDSTKLAQQRTAYETVLSLCLSEPRCKNFVVWGVRDDGSWINSRYTGFGSPLLFSGSGTTYTAKPAYYGLISVLQTTSVRGAHSRARAVELQSAGRPFDLRGRQLKSLPTGPTFQARKTPRTASRN
jgi:endo-1,4-beta-xylanase